MIFKLLNTFVKVGSQMNSVYLFIIIIENQLRPQAEIRIVREESNIMKGKERQQEFVAKDDVISFEIS